MDERRLFHHKDAYFILTVAISRNHRSLPDQGETALRRYIDFGRVLTRLAAAPTCDKADIAFLGRNRRGPASHSSF